MYYSLVKQKKKQILARIIFCVSVERHFRYQYTFCYANILIIKLILIQHYLVGFGLSLSCCCWMNKNHRFPSTDSLGSDYYFFLQFSEINFLFLLFILFIQFY